MKQVNLILVFNAELSQVLMCERVKDPYQGKLNFVGGKKKTDETDLEAAYRELREETGITAQDILLYPLYTTTYYQDGIELAVYMGRLIHDVRLVEELNPLIWVECSSDFTESRFAGNGNIQHMIDQAMDHKVLLYSESTEP